MSCPQKRSTGMCRLLMAQSKTAISTAEALSTSRMWLWYWANTNTNSSKKLIRFSRLGHFRITWILSRESVWFSEIILYSHRSRRRGTRTGRRPTDRQTSANHWRQWLGVYPRRGTFHLQQRHTRHWPICGDDRCRWEGLSQCQIECQRPSGPLVSAAAWNTYSDSFEGRL